MKTTFPKTVAWRVMKGEECIDTVYYLDSCKESHVLACVRHAFSNKTLTIVRDN